MKHNVNKIRNILAITFKIARKIGACNDTLTACLFAYKTKDHTVIATN